MRTSIDPGAEMNRSEPAGERTRPTIDSAPALLAEHAEEAPPRDRRDSFLIILLRALGAFHS
jgi:hypothetical protein